MRKFHESYGVTLMELTIAMALFAIIMGAAAQSLISYYVAMDIQGQRDAATQHCRGLLSDMRAVRDAPSPTPFPAKVVAQWPNGSVRPGTLRGQTLRVDYADPNANPLAVTVTSQSQDMKRRPIVVRLSTVLTDR